MKFKVGDKVRLKRGNDFTFVPSMERYVGRESVITSVNNQGGGGYMYHVEGNLWNWHESALELVESKSEPKEYFYVGQTVYSPLFQNKERKAVITKIDKDMDYPIMCEGEGIWNLFTLDGRYRTNDDFVSLFQEPIQFPVNKPIEIFKEGEIVEYSNDGVHWGLGYYVGIEKGEEHQHRVCTFKGMHDKLDSYGVWAKIKKFK